MRTLTGLRSHATGHIYIKNKKVLYLLTVTIFQQGEEFIADKKIDNIIYIAEINIFLYIYRQRDVRVKYWIHDF